LILILDENGKSGMDENDQGLGLFSILGCFS